MDEYKNNGHDGGDDATVSKEYDVDVVLGSPDRDYA